MQLSIETFYVTSNKISHERKKRKKRNSFLDNVKLDDEKIRRPLMTKKHLYTKSEGTYTYIKFLRGEKLNLMPPRFFLFFFHQGVITFLTPLASRYYFLERVTMFFDRD